MSKPNRENNYAFIDSQNLYLGVKNQGWKLDYRKFFRYLKDRYRVTKAIIFIGYIEANKPLYKFLEGIGYELIFKETINARGKTKGNVDAELVLHTMHELYEGNFDKAVIVTGDGDFQCLVEYLKERDKLKGLVIPDHERYSSLLRQYNKLGVIEFVSRQRVKLEL